MPDSEAPQEPSLLVALMNRPRPGPPLPDRDTARKFFADLDALCREHGYLLGRSTWETPEKGVAHFLVQVIDSSSSRTAR